MSIGAIRTAVEAIHEVSEAIGMALVAARDFLAEQAGAPANGSTFPVFNFSLIPAPTFQTPPVLGNGTGDTIITNPPPDTNSIGCETECKIVLGAIGLAAGLIAVERGIPFSFGIGLF